MSAENGDYKHSEIAADEQKVAELGYAMTSANKEDLKTSEGDLADIPHNAEVVPHTRNIRKTLVLLMCWLK